MSQPHVFVSHSHKDEDFTQRLVHDLHDVGAKVWVDVNGISHGNFLQSIDQALTTCEWMVLVLTPNAVSSAYVQDEVYAALHRVKQGHMRAVIPVLAAPCAPGTIPPQWDVLQRYDAMHDYEGAVDGVLRAIGLLRVPASAPPSPAPSSPKPPESAADLLARGEALLALRQRQRDREAVALFEQAVLKEPDNFNAWYALGRARHQDALDALVDLDDQDEPYDFTKAVAAFDRAVVLNPKSANAWFQKGLAAQHAHWREVALDAYEHGLALRPGSAVGWNGKGEALEGLKRFEEALEAHQRAIDFDPNERRFWFGKVRALRALGRIAEAQEVERCAPS